VVGTQVSVLLI